jgi:hexosaminidase
VERTCGAFEHRFKIWPRTAAIAERLWSNDTVTDLNSMHRRLKVIFRLEEVGITHIRNKEVILEYH